MTAIEPVDPDTMVGTYRWEIPNWSKITEEDLVSERFKAGGFEWQIRVYPRDEGDKDEYVGIYLQVPDLSTLPDGWERVASYSFTVECAAMSDDEDEDTIKNRSFCVSDSERRFAKPSNSCGYPESFSVAQITDPNGGLISCDDTVVITAEVTVRRVIIGVTCAMAARTETSRR